MPDEYPLSLAELLMSTLNRLDLSYREAEEKTGVGYSVIHRLATGKQQTTSDEVLAQLARGLRIPVRELRAAAGRASGLQAFTLPERAARLNGRERRLILAMVDALLAARDRED